MATESMDVGLTFAIFISIPHRVHVNLVIRPQTVSMYKLLFIILSISIRKLSTRNEQKSCIELL